MQLCGYLTLYIGRLNGESSTRGAPFRQLTNVVMVNLDLLGHLDIVARRCRTSERKPGRSRPV